MPTRGYARQGLDWMLTISPLSWVLLAACSGEPTSPPAGTSVERPFITAGAPVRDRLFPTRTRDNFQERYNPLIATLPAFAGLYVEDGQVVIRVAGAIPTGSDRVRVQAQLAQLGPTLPSAGSTNIRFESAPFSFEDLRDVYLRAFDALYQDRDVVRSGIDQKRSLIDVHIDPNGSSLRVKQRLTAAGVDTSMFRFVVESGAGRSLLSYLDSPFAHMWGDAYRTGGLQIRYFPIPGSYYHGANLRCTLGFNAVVGGYRGFITNSHCTSRRAIVDGDEMYQPASPYSIGYEILDPPMFTGGACPSGSICRWSDAAFIGYDSERPSLPGRIARPMVAAYGASGADPGGRVRINDADSVWNIVDAAVPHVGVGVVKVGAATGWTVGQILNDCMDYRQAMLGYSLPNFQAPPSDTLLLCQIHTSLYADHGDSGSPVFFYEQFDPFEPGRAWLVGLLFGEGPNYPFDSFASSFVKIELELGAISNYVKP